MALEPAALGAAPALRAAAVALVLASVVRALVVARRRAVHRLLVPRSGEVPSRRRHHLADGLAAVVPPAPRSVRRRLRRAGVPVAGADLIWRASVVTAAGAVTGAAAVGGVGAAVLVVVIGGLVVLLVVAAVGDRAAVLVDQALPGVLATIAAGVRSGASLTVAVAEGAGRARGPVAEDLAAVVDSLGAGASLVEALDRWTRERPTPGVRMAGAALSLAAETGGAGARTIDGVAATLRDRLAVDRELAALSSQARASAVVIGVAPVAFVLLTATSDPGVWGFFLRTPAGLGCLALGGVLDAVGAGWMLRVARGPR